MRKTELFQQILECVANQTELNVDKILSADKTYEVVDARYLLIYFLTREGFYASYIAQQTHLTPQGVRQIMRNFENRRKQSGKFFEINLQYIRHKLDTN